MLGLLVALALSGVRLVVMQRSPVIAATEAGAWLDIVTLVLWPSSIYLTGLMGGEPAKTVASVWIIAVVLNPPIYALGGWVAWRVLKAVHIVEA